MSGRATILASVVAAVMGSCYREASRRGPEASPAPAPRARQAPTSANTSTTTPPHADEVEAAILDEDGPRSAPPPIIANVDRAAILRAWQGIWAVGQDVTCEVRGDRFTEWEPASEFDGRIDVLAPCEIVFSGPSSLEMVPFTLRPSLQFGDSGFVRGGTTIVCAPDPYVLDGTGCRSWSHDTDGWHVRAADCGVRRIGGKSMFVIDDSARHLHRELAIRGDEIFDPKDATTVPPKGPYRSLEAAERAVTSDPTYLIVAQLSLLDSPAALIAWRAAGRNVDGRQVHLDAVFVGVDTVQRHGQSTPALRLANQRSTEAGIRDHSILCIPAASTPPPALGASIEATGTVHVTASAIELRGCAVRSK